MKYIINESQYFFLRRNIDLKNYFYKSLENIHPCKFKTFSSYFEQIVISMVLQIGEDNDEFRNYYLNDDNKGSELGNDVVSYVMENHFDTIFTYYKLKCKRELKLK